MNKLKIAVHNDDFHVDDVFSVATLLIYLNKSLDEVEVLRTRDEKIILEADYVLDVGFVYDKEKNRFDHHIGNISKRENGVPYATFGLLWKEYGEEICGSKSIAEKIEKKWVVPIDATDNGMLISEQIYPDFREIFLFDVIESLKPAWKIGGVSLEESFVESVELTKKIILREIERYKNVEESEDIFKKQYEKSDDKRFIILDSDHPWSDYIEKYKDILFVISPSTLGWKARSPLLRDGYFENRKKFPRDWFGLEGEKLAKVSGIEDALFCHKAGFIAVAKSKDGVIGLVKKALGA